MEETRHVLVYSTAYLPHIGGAELALKEITDRWPEGVTVTIITARLSLGLPRREHLGHADVVRIGIGIPFLDKLFLVCCGKRIGERILHGKKPDCVWAIMASYGGLAALAFKRAHPQVPFLLTLQEGDSLEHITHRARFLGTRFAEIFSRADAIQVISQYLAQWARAMGAHVEPEVIPNGVDVKSFVVRKSDFIGVENKTSKNITLITTSRLVKKNAVDDIIRALAHLPDKVILTVVGDGVERHSLEVLAKNLGVQKRVSFLGAIAPEAIPQALARADIFVRPSLSEGLGNSFLEAFAAGLPVIATPVGGIPDFLHDGETGWFAEVRNPESIAACVRYISDPAHREHVHTVIHNAYSLVEKEYSWKNIAERMWKLIEQNISVAVSSPVKKRIVLVTPLYPPEIGGPATYAALLVSHLPKDEFFLSVLCFKSVRRLPKVIRHIVFFFMIVWKGRNADIIFAQDTVSVGFPALCAAKILRKKFIVRVPGDYVWEQSVQRFAVLESIDEFQTKRYGFFVEILRRIQKMVVQNADLVITPSNYFNSLVSGWMTSSGTEQKSRVVTIYNGIDITPLKEVHCEHPLAGTYKKTIFSAGRLVPWKGFSTLISMMPKLPEWRLLIAGEGPDREHLQEIITRHQLQDRVVLTGQLSKTELLQHLASADIFILNTSFESFSYQIVEALFFGVPVIATRIGNLPEIIHDGHNGFLVEPNDIQAISDRIHIIESDTALRESFIREGKRTSLRFSIQETVTQLTKYIRNV